MSKTKRFLEQISENLGFSGEINKTVVKAAQTILENEVNRASFFESLINRPSKPNTKLGSKDE